MYTLEATITEVSAKRGAVVLHVEYQMSEAVITALPAAAARQIAEPMPTSTSLRKELLEAADKADEQQKERSKEKYAVAFLTVDDSGGTYGVNLMCPEAYSEDEAVGQALARLREDLKPKERISGYLSQKC